jgi:hypothetical protein
VTLVSYIATDVSGMAARRLDGVGQILDPASA